MQIKNFAILLASFAATNVLASPVPNAEAGLEARAEQAEQAAQAEQVQQGAQAEQGEQWYPQPAYPFNPNRNRQNWRPTNDWRDLPNPFPAGSGRGWHNQQCPWQQPYCTSCRGFYQGSTGVCGGPNLGGCPCI